MKKKVCTLAIIMILLATGITGCGIPKEVVLDSDYPIVEEPFAIPISAVAFLLALMLMLTACSKMTSPIDIIKDAINDIGQSNPDVNTGSAGQDTLVNEQKGTVSDSSERQDDAVNEAAPDKGSEAATAPKPKRTGKSINDIFDSILAENGVTDPTEITELDFYEKGIVLLDGIERFPNLVRLDLTKNRISDITPLAGLKDLQVLLLGYNEIEDITPLAQLKDLRNVYLHNNRIETLIDFSTLDKLETVTLEENGITDISCFENATSLRYLYLRGNSISDLTPVSGLSGLRSLNVAKNLVSDISPLKGLVNLQDLELSDNRITDITLLAGFVKLKSLRLGDNMITDIMPMQDMVLLENVVLRNNRISDITPLITMCENGGLSGFKYKGVDYDLDLRGNDLDSDQKDIAEILINRYNVRVFY